MRIRSFAVKTIVSALAAATCSSATAQVVSHLNLVSDKSQDISTLDAWKKTCIKDGMSDQDKAIAIFNTVVRYRHQANPPREFLTSSEAGGHVHDPLKTFHVYGYGQCCCAASEVIGLAQYLGLQARGRDITAHSVPEVLCNGKWSLVDGSVMNYHVKPDGTLASVDEMHEAIRTWRQKEHPELDTDSKLRAFAKNEGWKNGPALLAKSDKFYGKNGVNSAGWHGWPSTMQEYYKIEANPHDFCTIMGYQLNVQLRPGEKITRNFFSRGIEYTNDMAKNYYKELQDRKLLGIQTELGDHTPGRVGDGTIEWNVPMKDLKSVAFSSEPNAFVLRFPSSYVYVKGEATVNTKVAAGGAITVSFSDNNGLVWKEIARIDKSGEQKLDLTDLIKRRYDYRLKFQSTGSDSSVEGIKSVLDFQCSQAALPVITEGENKLTFSAGPQEGTVTIEGSTDTETAKKNNQLTIADFHPQLSGGISPNLRMKDATGDATFTVNTPGDMSRLRLSAAYRARDAKDGFDVQVSYDNGNTFTSAGKLEGGVKGKSVYMIIDKVPPATKSAQVKLAGSLKNTTLIFDLRIDADYKEPAGTFKPVKVTYNWDEKGTAKNDVHVAKNENDAWSINCGAGTVVKRYTMELAE
jgi:hypothetical protein